MHYLLIPSIIDRFLSFAQLIPCYPHIQNDPKFYPYFEHAVGAIDGSHMGCCPSAEDQDAAHDWRGLFIQNALAAYTIENFAFSMSLVDMKDLLQMLICMNQYMYLTSVCQLAAGKYCLADAGFGSCDALLVPYHGALYHSKEWGRADVQ